MGTNLHRPAAASGRLYRNLWLQRNSSTPTAPLLLVAAPAAFPAAASLQGHDRAGNGFSMLTPPRYWKYAMVPRAPAALPRPLSASPACLLPAHDFWTLIQVCFGPPESQERCFAPFVHRCALAAQAARAHLHPAVASSTRSIVRSMLWQALSPLELGSKQKLG